MNVISLTEARPQDIERIMDMEAHGFAAGNRELREVFEARIRTFPQGSLMAHLGADCIGCIFSEIWTACPQPSAEHFALSHDIRAHHDPVRGSELYLTSMTIAPAFRGRGFGTQVFLGCIEHVAGAFPQLTSALLLVNETWQQARSIYVAAGFQEAGRFKHFFHPDGRVHEDGIVMRRPIQTG